MRPATRTQIDDLGAIMSRETGIDTTTMPDTTRQEYKDEADINKLLYRYGVDNALRPGTFGHTINFDMNLQSALEAVADARIAWRNLPEDLRKRYPSWQQLLVALDAGELRDKTTEPTAPVEAPPLAP